jgi:hypothetical protein
MGDCQLVLRYFALRDDGNIRGSMKSMLDRAMERKATEEEGEALKLEFVERFTFLYNLFEGVPFVLPPDDKGHVRVSAAIYDASMVAINDLWAVRGDILNDAPEVKKRMLEATGDSTRMVVLTGQGNTAKAVKDRINLLRQIFRPD